MFTFLIFHYATSQKVAGLISDDIIEFFKWPNPSGHDMALRSNQKWVPGIFLGSGEAGLQSSQPRRHLWAECLEYMGNSMSHSPEGLHGLLQR
jgi:hypothetical protein